MPGSVFRSGPARHSRRVWLGVTLCWCAVVPAGWSQLEDAAAWELWERSMDLAGETYYEKVDEAGLTKAALDFLAARGGPSMAKLKPQEIGQDPAACRKALKIFIAQASTQPGKKTTAFEMVEAALAEVMERQLRYSHYYPAEDVEAFNLVDKGNPGLKVELGADGRFSCLPIEGGPAWRAGIRRGDELVSVDGRSVRGLALLRTGVLIRGPVDSRVQVQVRQISGRTLSAALRREVEAKGKISLSDEVGSPMLKIPEFNKNTLEELKPLLAQVPEHSTLTLDLQGNAGGDVSAAVQVAGLFLPGSRPLPIARRLARGEETLLTTEEQPVVKLLGITILMNSGTASASELLALALQEGMEVPVTLSGSKSYGKGTFQVQHSLNSGGLLTLATGQLTTAKGTAWEGKGIEPLFSPAGR